MLNQKLFIVVNVDWFFLSHRLPIALAAKERGYDVTILAIEEEGKGPEIESYGLKFIPLPSTRGGRNIFSELQLLWFLCKIYKKEKPDIIHHVAIKPVLYGSIAAKFTNVQKVINAVSGLGSTFIKSKIFSPTLFIVKKLYQFSFTNKKIQIIAQNNDDIQQLLQLGPLSRSQIKLIKGSGVNLNEFEYTAEQNKDVLQIILPSRMLKDKGVFEFVKAAEMLKAKFGDKINFVLAGKTDPENASAISEKQLLKWNQEGNVEWIGHQTNMIQHYKNATIVVLPSYREGLPKSLIEACAIGRPIITTDVPGCKEVVDDGVNGFLVPLKDHKIMASKIEILILDKELRLKMGKAGRKKAENEFSIENVIEKTLALYQKDKKYSPKVLLT